MESHPSDTSGARKQGTGTEYKCHQGRGKVTDGGLDGWNRWMDERGIWLESYAKTHTRFMSRYLVSLSRVFASCHNNVLRQNNFIFHTTSVFNFNRTLHKERWPETVRPRFKKTTKFDRKTTSASRQSAGRHAGGLRRTKAALEGNLSARPSLPPSILDQRQTSFFKDRPNYTLQEAALKLVSNEEGS